jgi:O-succinylhomoserine sulfhydrylase
MVDGEVGDAVEVDGGPSGDGAAHGGPAHGGRRRQRRPDTAAVRGGLRRTGEKETAEALFLTSGFTYDSAEEARATFAGELDRYRYSRAGNPTVAMLERRLAELEDAERGLAVASGMAAVHVALLSCTRAGSRIVASRSLFGSCLVILTDLLPRFGVTTELVDGTDLDEWERALARGADVAFFESPSNPMQELVDIAAVAERAHAVGATVVVDNAFLPPTVQHPLALGADLVTYSTTKHTDGHGRTLGGMVLGDADRITGQVVPWLRHTGPSLSPFNAWVQLSGLVTLPLRRDRAAASALELATWLEQQPGVTSVRHPFLPSHPQHDLARRQMTHGGSVVTLEVAGGTVAAFGVLDALELVDISNNFADARSLAVHPATTTHHRIGPGARAAAGITDGTIRLSVGLEDVEDLRDDLARALSTLR